MHENEVVRRAFAMPLTNPAYPPGPYRFVNREYLIITYRTDPAKLRAVVPEPLELDQHEALVKYEFIRMPDSNGFGDYTETGQVIPVRFNGEDGVYIHSMYRRRSLKATSCAPRTAQPSATPTRACIVRSTFPRIF